MDAPAAPVSQMVANLAALNNPNKVLEAVKLISNLSAYQDSPEIQDAIDALAVDLNPQLVGTDWPQVFQKATAPQHVFSTVWWLFKFLFGVGGVRAISAFLSHYPFTTNSAEMMLSRIEKLPQVALTVEFHFPQVFDSPEQELPFNYEIIAAFLYRLATEGILARESLLDENIAGVLLVYTAKNKLSASATDNFAVLAYAMIEQESSLNNTVFQNLVKYPYGNEMLLTVASEIMSHWATDAEFFQYLQTQTKDEKEKLNGKEDQEGANEAEETGADPVLEQFFNKFSTLMSKFPDQTLQMFDSWLRLEQQGITTALRYLLYLDHLAAKPQWALFVQQSIASSPEAFANLVSYLLLPECPPVSLSLSASVAVLTQSSELPATFTERREKLQALQLLLLQNNPRLINFGHGHDEAILANQALPTFPAPIEEEMRTCFQRMYEQQYDIPDVVTLLGRLKSSDVPEDQDLFACVVYSLFDEYHFFAQYPVKALATTAVLFGSLVSFRLIEGTPLAVALKFVLDALKHPSDSNMFRFGLQALVEMCPRLPEFPKYCDALMQVPGLQNDPLFLADLKGYIDPKSEKVVFKSVNPVLEDGPAESSPKLDFAVNNLSSKTLVLRSTEITKEIASLGSVKFVRLLVNRASKEPNNHGLYASLLDLLPTEVMETCTNAILARVATMLASPDLLNSEPRQHLQNLGQFLGMVTLARNRALLFHHIHLKLLIAEAYSLEKLSAVLPFVTKLLAQCSSSKVFTKNSPWVCDVLSVLSELYKFGKLGLNLKFAIEVLGQNLKVDIPNWPEAMYIRDERMQGEDIISISTSVTGQPPGGHPPMAVPVGQVPVAGGPQALQPLQTLQNSAGGQVPLAQGPAGPAGPSAPPGMSPLPSNLGPNQPLMAQPPNAPLTQVPAAAAAAAAQGSTEFSTHPALRQMLEVARNKTVQEVLHPVIDRSVSVASFTARELVAKDYAFEKDLSKKQAATHALVLQLAPSMSFVTTREPFVEAMVQNLRQLLIAHNFGDASLFDQSIIAARETFDQMLPLIDNVSKERAIFEVNEAAAHPQPPAPGINQIPQQMPGLLGHYPEMSAQQHEVYLSFTNSQISEEDELKRISDLLVKLDSLTSKHAKLVDLKTDDEVLDVLTQFVNIVEVCARKNEEIPLHVSVIIIQLLFKSTYRLHREALCLCLGELCKVSSLTAKEIVMWLLYADDTKKYNADVISTLLRSRLVTPAEIDASLTKDLSEPEVKPTVVSFAVKLVLDAIMGPEPYCLRSDFAGAITVLAQLAQMDQFPAAKILVQALEDAKGDGFGNEAHVFAEWTRLIQHHISATSPVLLHKFVRDLHASKWLEGTQLVTFITTAVNVSVKSYLQSHSFVGVDAVALLISTILETSGNQPQVARSLLSIIVLSLAKDHDDAEFDSLPYYRLLSSVACSLNSTLLPVIGDIVLALQPQAFSGFTASWITLMSHRHIMGKLLETKENWHTLKQLFVALFMSLREIWLNETSTVTERGFTYRAVERICLVVLHDEPEFFLRYGQELSVLLVFEFVQLKNMLQSGFPQTIQLPDPSELEGVEYLSLDPSTLGMISDSRLILNKIGVLKMVESACQSRHAAAMPPTTIASIDTGFTYQTPLADRGIDFDSIPISMNAMNSLVSVISSMAHGVPIEEFGGTYILAKLLNHVQKESRYFVISAIVNFLKYPDHQTEFCLNFMLQLFLPLGEKLLGSLVTDIRHITTRVLLERLVSYRPHPWGVMAVFMALLRTKEYNFWELPFVKSSPEVANLFSTLAPTTPVEPSPAGITSEN